MLCQEGQKRFPAPFDLTNFNWRHVIDGMGVQGDLDTGCMSIKLLFFI